MFQRLHLYGNARLWLRLFMDIWIHYIRRLLDFIHVERGKEGTFYTRKFNASCRLLGPECPFAMQSSSYGTFNSYYVVTSVKLLSRSMIKICW